VLQGLRRRFQHLPLIFRPVVLRGSQGVLQDVLVSKLVEQVNN
jgi:hypothetical protein